MGPIIYQAWKNEGYPEMKDKKACIVCYDESENACSIKFENTTAVVEKKEPNKLRKRKGGFVDLNGNNMPLCTIQVTTMRRLHGALVQY